MTNDILLTIAIPTYNGAKTIERSLATILSELDSSLEVLVSDNASTDGTSDLIMAVAAKFPQVHYFRNETNVGFNRNVNLCVRRAQGRFVWLISDDDIICRKGAVAQVLQVINAHPDLGAIFADSRHTIRLNSRDSGLCIDGSDFFRRCRFKSGLISSNIVRKDAWQAVPIERYIGGGWIHLGFLIHALVHFPSYVICEELVAQLSLEQGKGHPRWGGSGSFLRTGIALAQVYREMSTLGYDPAIVRAAYLSIKGGYWRNIPLAKAVGLQVDKALIVDFARVYKAFPSFWLVDLPLLLLPGIIFKWARLALHALRGKRHFHGQ